MAEDDKTLWVGNLDEKVTEELIFELFLQAGPIQRLVFPTEGEGEDKKHKGHAYVVFRHRESVPFSSQVLEGTTLFSQPLSLKARALPLTYKSSPAAGNNNSNFSNGRSRFDNSSLRGGYSTRTWHGRDDFAPRGRGGYKGGRDTNYGDQSNKSYGNYGRQNSWSSNQHKLNQNFNSNDSINEHYQEKRQSLFQQQSLSPGAHCQMQQGMAVEDQLLKNMQHQNWSDNSGGYQNWNNSGGGSWYGSSSQ